MLKQRVVTALLMLAVLLPALFYQSAQPFCAMGILLIGAAAWEWGRLNQCNQATSVFWGVICAAMCLLSWWLGMLDMRLPLVWTVTGALWVLLGAQLLRGGVAAWSRYPPMLRQIVGVLALWLAWLALAQARVIGINFILSAMTLVWMADIAAYFAGKNFGGRFTKSKLAPSISPGKSWEGVWGGVTGVLLLGMAWVWLDAHWAVSGPSLYTALYNRGVWLFLIALVFLVAMSVVGDLVESLVKRSAGVKDSSALLPGHGGVLDRIDALLPALPLAMMLYSL